MSLFQSRAVRAVFITFVIFPYMMLIYAPLAAWEEICKAWKGTRR